MAQAKVADLLTAPSDRRNDQFDRSALVMAVSEVKAHWPAAAGAIVAIAVAERTDAFGLLLAAELPRVEISGDRRTGHEATLTQEHYYAVSDSTYCAGADFAVSAFASALAFAVAAAALPALSASSASRRSFAAR